MSTESIAALPGDNVVLQLTGVDPQSEQIRVEVGMHPVYQAVL